MTKLFKTLLPLDIQFFATVIDPIQALSPAATVREIGPLMENIQPYLGDVLFPDGPRQLDLELKYIQGVSRVPVVLKPSVFDTKAPLRTRETVKGLSHEMPLFRETRQMTESDWRRFIVAMNSNIESAYRDALRRVYDDRFDLITGARAQVERMKMQVLSTGKIGIYENGQSLDYDFGLPSGNITTNTAAQAWSNPAADILTQIDAITDAAIDAGQPLRYAVTTSKTLRQLRTNTQIQELVGAENPHITVNALVAFFLAEWNITLFLNDDVFRDANEHKVQPFFPNDVISFFATPQLGEMIYSYTTEEMALLDERQSGAEVEVMESGLALTRIIEPHIPIHSLMASQICLPSFTEGASVFILNTEPADDGSGTP